jgi:hypothetical protein
MFIIAMVIILLPFMAAQLMQPIEGNSVPIVLNNTEDKNHEEEEPLKALKMIGPEPMEPGQKGVMKTAYFDSKVNVVPNMAIAISIS